MKHSGEENRRVTGTNCRTSRGRLAGTLRAHRQSCRTCPHQLPAQPRLSRGSIYQNATLKLLTVTALMLFLTVPSLLTIPDGSYRAVSQRFSDWYTLQNLKKSRPIAFDEISEIEMVQAEDWLLKMKKDIV